jgi:uncharacterized protein YigE (DUF2233 family)
MIGCMVCTARFALIAWGLASCLAVAARAADAPAAGASASLSPANAGGAEILITTVDTQAWRGRIVRAADKHAFLARKDRLLLNGGSFTADAEPAGLVLDHGTAWGALAPATPGSGFAWADAFGGMHIDGGGMPPADAQWAIQCGPMLVEPGGALGIHAPTQRAPRTVLALRMPGEFLVVSTGSIGLQELAEYLIARGVERAITLDGGPSRELHYRSALATSDRPSHALVPYYLGFAPAR